MQRLWFLHARKSCRLFERKTTKNCSDHIQSHARKAKDWNMLLGFDMVWQRCAEKTNCFYRCLENNCERCAEHVQLRDGSWSQKCYNKCDMGEYHPYFDTTPDYLTIAAGAAGVKGTTKGHCFLMGVFLSYCKSMQSIVQYKSFINVISQGKCRIKAAAIQSLTVSCERCHGRVGNKRQQAPVIH